MRSNFNAGPSTASAAEYTSSGWDAPIIGGAADWGSLPAAPAVEQNPWAQESNGYEANDWTSGDWGELVVDTSTNTGSLESNNSERLKEFRNKLIHGLGAKALEKVMGLLPDFKSKNVLQATSMNVLADSAQRQRASEVFSNLATNPSMFKEQAIGSMRSAGGEIANAGLQAAKESVMNYYGLEKDENDKLRIARKMKFGRAAVKTLVNPVGTASSVGVRAGHAARKASKQSAKDQFRSAATSFAAQPARHEVASW